MRAKTDRFPADLAELSAAAKTLSHPARLQILRVLADNDACICGDIVDELPLAQATVSRHLKALKEANLITVTADGPRSCYRLNADAIRALSERFGVFFDSIQVPAAPC